MVDVVELAGAPGRFPKDVKSVDWLDILKGNFKGLDLASTREEIRKAAGALTVGYFGLMTVLALIPIEGEFAAIAVGRTIAETLGPVVKRTIADPMDAVLRQAFRVDAPNARVLIQMMQEGVITTDQLAEFIGDTEVSDKYLPLLEAYTRSKQNEKAIALEAQMAEALVSKYTMGFDLLVNRAETELVKVRAD